MSYTNFQVLPLKEAADLRHVAGVDEGGRSCLFPFAGREVADEFLLQGYDDTDQEPVALDTPTQVKFGPAQTNEFFDLAADGSLTVVTAHKCVVSFRFLVGRTTAPDVAHMFFRVLVNGTQVGRPTHAIIDSQRVEIPLTFEMAADAAVGDVLTVEMMADSAGNNIGGLYTAVATTLNWGNSPSALILVERRVLA